MHIPDGYLSPQTCAALSAVMVPVWAGAAWKTARQLETREVPLLALGAAFSFVIMMFNIPVPGGTQVHAAGATLTAIVLGPWGACVALTVALAIQAFVFGDGGIWALGANCFNIAFVMPFAGYFFYRLCRGSASADGKQSTFAGAAAGYLAINLGALCMAVEFGLQPLLFHDAAGNPLYNPYPLEQALPAVALAHLTLGGLAEAAVTAAALGFAGRTLIRTARAGEARPAVGRLWYGLGGLALLCPLGLLAAGTAWGEWTGVEAEEIMRHVPAGLARLAGAWRHVPLPGYKLPGLERGFLPLAVGYILSALAGVGLVVAISRLVGRLLARKA